MANIIPKAALDYIKNKKLRVGFSYKDVWNEEHAAAFTVAKAMQMDVLSDLHKAVTDAIGNGLSFDTFKKNLRPALQQKGWWGRKDMIDPLTGKTVNAQLGSDRRLKTIYNVNMRSAYQKGQYDRTMESDLHPYLMYRIGPSINHREEHVRWDGLILPKDDPWWDSHFPPNGWGCKCYTRAVTESQKEKYETEGVPVPPGPDGRGGGTLRVKTVPPRVTYKPYINERKGTVEHVPAGVDPAFNWNVGKGRNLDALKEKIEEASKKLHSIPTVEEKIKNIAGIENVSLSGIPDNVQQGMLEGYEDVLGRYPELHGKFKLLNTAERRKKVMASCILEDGSISINRKFFKSITVLTTAYDEDVASEWFPAGTNWKAVIVHEVGHRVNGILKWQYWSALNGVPVETYIRDKALANLGLNEMSIKKELSEYAGQDAQEFLAEAFSEFFISKSPRRLAREAIRLIDLAMKGKLL